MAASTSSPHSLKALVVFRNDINKELVRTIHVYQPLGEAERVIEREYFFHKEHDYNEAKDIVSRILTRQGFDVKRYHVGLLEGVWQCILVFDRDAIADIEDIPDLLITFRNSKLAAIPTLANDLDIVFSHKYERDNASPVLLSLEVPSGFVRRQRTPRVPMFDLNYPPPCEPENEESNPRAAGLDDKKQKLAAPKEVSRLAFEDLAKYFDLRNHQGFRKFKCWPYTTQEKVVYVGRGKMAGRGKRGCSRGSGTVAVAKMQRMIESEKESIERKLFLDMKLEYLKSPAGHRLAQGQNLLARDYRNKDKIYGLEMKSCLH